MRLIWDETAWVQYLHWQENDRAILRKINALLKECLRAPFVGIGKPEALKGDLRGYWSRRITHEHRLVYKVRLPKMGCASRPAAFTTKNSPAAVWRWRTV